MKISDIPQLTFEEVDELIDSNLTFIFRDYEWDVDRKGEKFLHFSAWPKRGQNRTGERGNVARLIVSVVEDNQCKGLKEDSEGYVDSSTAILGGYSWTARDWTDEEVDNYLNSYLGLDSVLASV